MNKDMLRLFAISFVTLFMEIFLIRWISTEVRIFAYVNNLALLACFLGIGIGAYFSRKKADILITLGAMAVLAYAVGLPLFQNITTLLSRFPDSVIWEQVGARYVFWPALGGLILTVFLFLTVVIAFVPPGQILGRCLDESRNIILGYSINIAGSLAGLWAFNACSFFFTRPWSWFALSAAILVFFLPRTRLRILAGIAVSFLMVLAAGVFKDTGSIWTPYQKLDVNTNPTLPPTVKYWVSVNNTSYMLLIDLSDEFTRSHLDPKDFEMKKYNQYELPYQFAGRRDHVLIVGAGAGNDAAGAVRSGAANIDAVEIDPGIFQIGRRLHPERPYLRENVSPHIDDARSFLKKTRRTYDVISFGLLDSHILGSTYNNLRLDHYVYTKECFETVKRALRDDGVVTVMFQPDRQWIAQRIYGLLKSVFGEVPYAFTVYSPKARFGSGGIMFVTGNAPEQIRANVESNPGLKQFIEERNAAEKLLDPVKLTTDDWPYLYIEKPGIPKMYQMIMAAVLALVLAAGRFIFRHGESQIDWHFFFLGAAFLLLEFQNVSKSALLFGSTWLATSYTISSILVLILLANVFVHYFNPGRTNWMYALLLGSVAVGYLVPLGAFSTFGHAAKLTLAVSLLNLPIFFAGVIFIRSFQSAPSKDVAFGSNLLGAAVGGVLESLSFITGIRALLIVVFVLYLVSLFCMKAQRRENA